MSNNTETLEKILHSKKVAYKNFIPMIKPYVDRTKINQNVNIFIDLWDILKQLYNPKIIESFSLLNNEDRFTITSELINLVSHYRHYFGSRLEKYTTFYFFISSKESLYHKKIYKDYKKDFYEKRLNENNSIFGNLNKIIMDTFKTMKIIMQFIPNCYFINTSSIDSNVIPYFIISESSDNDDLNIIISNDELQYQCLLLKNTLILELRGEKTRFSIREDIIDNLLSSTKKTSSDYPNILPDNLNIFLPFISQKNYNIESIKNMGITRALSFTEKMIEKDLIKPLSEYINNDILLNALKENGLNDEEVNKYSMNYSLINFKEVIEKNRNTYVNILESSLIDREDPEGLRKMNEKYFSKSPILLNYCYEGF